MSTKSGVFKFRFDSSNGTYEKRGDARQILKRLVKNFGGFKARLFVYFAVTAAYSVSYVLLPRLLGGMLDTYAGAVLSRLLGVGEASLDGIGGSAATVAAVFILNALCSYTQGRLVSSVTTDYAYELRKGLFEKLNRLPVSYFDSTEHTLIKARLSSDADALLQSVNLLFSRALTSAFTAAAVLVMQLKINVLSAALVAAVSVVSCAAQLLLDKRQGKKAAASQAAAGGLFAEASEYFSGLDTVRNSGRLDAVVAGLQEKSNSLAEGSRSAAFISSLQSSITQLSCGACLIGITVYGAIGAQARSISVGVLQSEIIYTRKLFQCVSQLSLFSGIIRTAVASAGNIYDFLDEREAPPCTGIRLPDIDGRLTFSNVSFSYPLSDDTVLKNLSFTINSTGITAITGVTGSGKSTIIKLLLGFYRPDSGRVCLDGVPVTELDPDDYLSRFSYITQGSLLFDGSPAQNITYGLDGCTKQQMDEALRLSTAQSVIDRLPDGIDTCIDGGVLSDGEAQLIMLAGALLKNSRYIVFDEATSNVDSVTEQKIYRALKEISRSRAVIVIAHRKSILAYADDVISAASTAAT